MKIVTKLLSMNSSTRLLRDLDSLTAITLYPSGIAWPTMLYGVSSVYQENISPLSWLANLFEGDKVYGVGSNTLFSIFKKISRYRNDTFNFIKMASIGLLLYWWDIKNELWIAQKLLIYFQFGFTIIWFYFYVLFEMKRGYFVEACAF